MGYSVVDGRLLSSHSILPRIRDLGVASGSPYKFEYHLCDSDFCFFPLAPHSHCHSSIVGPRCMRSRSLPSALAQPPSRSSLSLLLSLLVVNNPSAAVAPVVAPGVWLLSLWYLSTTMSTMWPPLPRQVWLSLGKDMDIITE